MQQVILEYSNEEVKQENFTDIILTDILASCDQQLLKESLNNNSLKNLYKKYGDKAFLLPKQLKYPIINPITGKKDQTLLHAAYIDLKRKSGITGYGDLTQKARDMLDENSFLVEIGSNKIPLLEYIDLIF